LYNHSKKEEATAGGQPATAGLKRDEDGEKERGKKLKEHP
jgi:hypothetical protein